MNEWVFGTQLAAFSLFIWLLMFLVGWRESIGNMYAWVTWEKFKDMGRFVGVPGPWDYWTNGPADVFALPLIDFAVGATMYQRGVELQIVVIATLMALLATYAWFRMATRLKRAQKNNDWWFRSLSTRDPASKAAKTLGVARLKIAIAGRIHLFYFAFQFALWAIGMNYLRTSQMTTPVVVTFVVGILLYVSATALDMRQKHFD